MKKQLQQLLLTSTILALSTFTVQASPITDTAEWHIADLTESKRVITKTINHLSDTFKTKDDRKRYRKQQIAKLEEIEAMQKTFQIIAGYSSEPY